MADKNLDKNLDRTEKNDGGTVRAVDRALSILDCFSNGQTSFSLTELSKALGLSLTTTLRIIGTLENRDYIRRNPDDGRYYLGFRLSKLGSIALSNMDISRIAQPFLRTLLEQFNESVGIYILQNDSRVCVARLNGTNSLRFVVMLGDTLPLTRGAAGRTLLAHMPESDIRRLLADDPFTTIEELAELRNVGFARSHGERDSSVESFSAPIFNADGEITAAVFLTGPIKRFTEEKAAEIIPAIKLAAHDISVHMGYHGN
ncbi:MAG: IclR family transcriptional regulator [Lachnospiraceae bacterium]|nr:IclR family transcriptional regulator [Lachnospiraceae bacterium]